MYVFETKAVEDDMCMRIQELPLVPLFYHIDRYTRTNKHLHTQTN